MAEIELVLRTATLKDATGLIHAMRITSYSRWAALDVWLWLDRETDTVGELVPYRVGMEIG